MNWPTRMTSTHDGASDGHGPRFMGLYLQLLDRYLRLPAASAGGVACCRPALCLRPGGTACSSWDPG
jgi:hypothetical protein